MSFTSLLLVGIDDHVSEGLLSSLAATDCTLIRATLDEVERNDGIVGEEEPDLIVLDSPLDAHDSLITIKSLDSRFPDIPVVGLSIAEAGETLVLFYPTRHRGCLVMEIPPSDVVRVLGEILDTNTKQTRPPRAAVDGDVAEPPHRSGKRALRTRATPHRARQNTVRCLRCRRPFASRDRRTNRLCGSCKDAISSIDDGGECSLGVHV